MIDISTKEKAIKIIDMICENFDLEFNNGKALLCDVCEYCILNDGKCILDKDK